MMPGTLCPVCKQWIVPDPKRPQALHICDGKAGPELQRRKLKSYAADLMNSGKQIPMDLDREAQGVPPAARKLFDFALGNFLIYGPTDRASREQQLDAAVGDRTVKDFAAPLTTLEIVNKLWNAIVVWRQPDKSPQDMVDPAPGDPIHTVSSTKRDKAFNALGIGFRCEKESDLQRILNQGCKPLYALPDVAQGLGHAIGGTVMQLKTQQHELGLWTRNKDAVGQTGICVARGAKGATKFPEAEYQGVVCLFAVKPSLRGFDTEEHQRKEDPKGSAVWKPGEKLFPEIPPADILGYVRVEKTGMLAMGMGWNIRVRDQQWQGLRGTADEQAYLNGELAELTPGQPLRILSKTHDFHEV